MAYEMKDGSFALFYNPGKEDNEKAPDYTGKGKIDGKEYRVAAWWKQTQDGNDFLAGTIQIPQLKQKPNNKDPRAPGNRGAKTANTAPPVDEPQAGAVPDPEDDLPF